MPSERATIYEHQPWKDLPRDTAGYSPKFPLYRSTSLAGERETWHDFAFHAFALVDRG